MLSLSTRTVIILKATRKQNCIPRCKDAIELHRLSIMM
jgi:hypothetical protein